ncbi:MAG: cyclic nucleotide-binding protein [Acidobacteria bacterium]|nr:MAG: cyclic nucleotide-binding protein [Acidobacteriota bacterium]
MPVDPALLEDIEFFKLLDEADRRALAEVVDLIKLQDNQTLFQAGEPGESLFLVRAGEVELFIKDTTGQKIILDITRPGDFFGEIALLDAGPRSATALALTPTELIELDRADLVLLFQKKPEAALHMLAAMGKMTRKADELLRTRVSRNVNEEVEENLTVVQRIADWLAWFSGSMPFLLIHALWFIVWISLNTFLLPQNPDGTRGFDPFPFGLLTMIVSLEAIFLACFVLISQNRQAQKDKVRGDIEYDVNIKAELEVAELHQKADHIHEEMLRRFSNLEKLLPRQSAPTEEV